jgi:quercetin dioxygenase-like cupin family protein
VSHAEVIVRDHHRDISILLARAGISIVCGEYAAGERVADAHVHHEHTDAFYVLEGELTLELGCDAEVVTLRAGDFVAVPPGVAHALRNDGDRPMQTLSIHARDGGFADFMRGIRDGVAVAWDMAPAPANGGLDASRATVRRTLQADGILRQPDGSADEARHEARRVRAPSCGHRARDRLG